MSGAGVERYSASVAEHVEVGGDEDEPPPHPHVGGVVGAERFLVRNGPDEFERFSSVDFVRSLSVDHGDATRDAIEVFLMTCEERVGGDPEHVSEVAQPHPLAPAVLGAEVAGAGGGVRRLGQKRELGGHSVVIDLGREMYPLPIRRGLPVFDQCERVVTPVEAAPHPAVIAAVEGAEHEPLHPLTDDANVGIAGTVLVARRLIIGGSDVLLFVDPHRPRARRDGDVFENAVDQCLHDPHGKPHAVPALVGQGTAPDATPTTSCLTEKGGINPLFS